MKRIEFSFEKGGNPDPHELAWDLNLAIDVDHVRKRLMIIVPEADIDKVRSATEAYGYTFAKVLDVKDDI